MEPWGTPQLEVKGLLVTDPSLDSVHSQTPVVSSIVSPHSVAEGRQERPFDLKKHCVGMYPFDLNTLIISSWSKHRHDEHWVFFNLVTKDKSWYSGDEFSREDQRQKHCILRRSTFTALSPQEKNFYCLSTQPTAAVTHKVKFKCDG